MFALFLSIMAAGLVLNLAMAESDPAADPSTDDGSGTDGGGGGQDPSPGPFGTAGADDLTVPATATGRLDALGGDDSITVEAETGAPLSFESPSLTSYFWETDDGAAPLVVDGGAGDDSLLLSGNGYAVTGGDGDDRIELGDARNVTVAADGADTVVGGTGQALVTLTEASSYIGSNADETVVSDTSGTIAMGGGNDRLMNAGSGQVDMGAGNDWVFGQDGASSVLGGAGNDTLIGTRSDLVFSASATDLLSYYTSEDSDTLDGGTGDDLIAASHGDVVTSGAGADRINLYLEADPALSGTEITDFDPAQDQLVIAHDYFGDVPVFGRDPVPFTGEVTVTETPAGDTIITGRDGQVLATLRGVTGLSIGVEIAELTDLDGNPTPGASYDVVLTRFFNVTS